jgi:hypothetical protein
LSANDLNPQIVWGAKFLADGTRPQQDLNGIMGTTLQLEIKSDLWSVFPVVSWAFSNSPELLESGNLYIGREIQLFFNQSLKNTLVTFTFVVYALENLPGATTSSLGDTYQLTLVTPWVFQQLPKSKAYKGTSSDIISQVLGSELTKSLTPGVLVQSQEPIGVRYRTFQTPYNFLTKRVFPYLRGKDDTTIFSYTTLQGEYEIIDYSQMKNEQKFILIHLQHPAIPAFQADINQDEKGKYFLHPHGNSMSLGTSEGGGLWNYLDPKTVTLSTSDIGVVKSQGEAPFMVNMTGNLSKPFTMVSPNRDKEMGKIYLDDSLRSQEDILSDNFNKYTHDLLNSQRFVSTCYFNPYVRIGRIVTVYLTTLQTGKLSLYTQDYIITGFTHKIEKGLFFTDVEYSTTGFVTNTDTRSIASTLYNK